MSAPTTEVNTETKASTSRPRTKTQAQKNMEERDRKIRSVAGQGWQLIRDTLLQSETASLLKSAAKRCKLDIQINQWEDGKTVTYKVTKKEEK